MKYKTIIEIVTEADNSHDAADIAGEYLRGNLETGVLMRCNTRQMNGRKQFFVSIVVLLLTGSLLAVSSLFLTTNNQSMASRLDALSCKKSTAAVQPPLKTQDQANDSAYFKKAWDNKQNEITIKEIPPATK